MTVKFSESEKSNGVLFVSWQAGCAEVFNEVLDCFRTTIPEANWDSAQKLWVVPKEYTYAYYQIKQRYEENDINAEPIPFKKTFVFTYDDDVHLCVGFQSPPGLFFEIKDIFSMIETGCLEKRIIHLEENRTIFIAAAKLQRGERQDITKEDLISICNAHWTSEQLKSKARSELSYRKKMELDSIVIKSQFYVEYNQTIFIFTLELDWIITKSKYNMENYTTKSRQTLVLEYVVTKSI